MLTVRPDLPPMPKRIARLPIDQRGYPVPWFVYRDENGVADFRVIRPSGREQALHEHRCWTCGDILGRYATYIVGPMCTATLTTGEPPNHTECAEFAVRACPFLSRPGATRREEGLPDGRHTPGIPILRNPGVCALWTTRGAPIIRRAPNGFLLKLPFPERVDWWREGREATRAEVEESIESGCPSLLELAKQEGPAAEADFARLLEIARAYLPAEVAL